MLERMTTLGTLTEGFYKMFIGAEAELRCFDLLREARMPPWYYGFRESTPEEDLEGCDCIVYTDAGQVQVQIKSSELYARNSVYRHPTILVLVISPAMPTDQLTQYVIFRLNNWRTKRLALMRKWKPQWGPIANFPYAPH